MWLEPERLVRGLRRMTGSTSQLQARSDSPPHYTTFTRETCFGTHFIQAEILLLSGSAILPAPAVPASTRISAWLKRSGTQLACEDSLDRRSSVISESA